MNKLRSICVILLVLSGSFAADAQTAKWLIPPLYNSVTPFSEGVYKVKAGYRSGLVGEDGTVLVEATADSITSVSEGYSLIMDLENGKYRLKSIFSTDKKLISFTDTYYVGDYPFFSDGKLPVYNIKGKYGFINNNGRLIIDFDYATVRPFSEGLAAVSKKSLINSLVKKGSGGGKVVYINEEGKPLTLQSEIGDIYDGTSFKNGEALVVNKDRKQYLINPLGAIVRIDNNIPLIFDEKYCLTSGIAKEEQVFTPVRYDGPTPYAENDLYGYRQGEQIVLPAQFSEAMPFSGQLALVWKNGKAGMLKLLPDSFSGQQVKGTLPTSDATLEAVDYMVTIPEEWRNAALSLSLGYEDKKSNVTSSLPGDGVATRLFSFLLPRERTAADVILEGNDLILWKSSTNAKKAVEIVPLEVTVPASAKANEKDVAYFSIKFSNKNQEPMEVKVEISGDRLQSVSKTLVIPAGTTERISTFYRKVQKEEIRTILIKTSVTEDLKKSVKLIPFFTEF